ncbi:MAG: hypothetical protein AAFQ09_10165 [Pseudomonadota bacterium]
MDTTLTFAPKTVAAMPYVAEREPPRDNKVPVVKGFEGAATLPANKPFVAQVVNARLSGTDFPEQPGEIVPAERTLRPYGTPMLPSENRTEPEPAPQEKTNQTVDTKGETAQQQPDELAGPSVNAVEDATLSAVRPEQTTERSLTADDS